MQASVGIIRQASGGAPRRESDGASPLAPVALRASVGEEGSASPLSEDSTASSVEGAVGAGEPMARASPHPGRRVDLPRLSRTPPAAGLGRPSRRCGTRLGSGLARTFPPPPVVVAPAGGRPPSTPRMCVCGRKPLVASPMDAGAAASAPPHSAWQRRRAHVGSPADRWGGGFRLGVPRAAPRTEAPRICSRARQQWRATSAAYAPSR